MQIYLFPLLTETEVRWILSDTDEGRRYSSTSQVDSMRGTRGNPGILANGDKGGVRISTISCEALFKKSYTDGGRRISL